MTDKQKELLQQLKGIINELSLECEQDDSFNFDVMGSLNIFTKSLDEIEINIEEI